MVKNPPAMQETWLNLWVRKIPWRRKWLPTPLFLPGEFHGQRNLAGYSPWGCRELDRTLAAHNSSNMLYSTSFLFKAE